MKNKLFPVFTLLLLCLFTLWGCRQASESVNPDVNQSHLPVTQATPEEEKSDIAIMAPKPEKVKIFIGRKLQADLDGDGQFETIKAWYSQKGDEWPDCFIKIVKQEQHSKALKQVFAKNFPGDKITELKIWDHPQAGKLLLIKDVGGSGSFLRPVLLRYDRAAGKIVEIPLIDKPSLWHGRCTIEENDLNCSGCDENYHDRFRCEADSRPPRINYIYRYNPGRKAFLLAQTIYELPYQKDPKPYFNALDLIEKADKSGNKGYRYQAAIKILKNLQAKSNNPVYQTAIDYCNTQIKNLKHKKA